MINLEKGQRVTIELPKFKIEIEQLMPGEEFYAQKGALICLAHGKEKNVVMNGGRGTDALGLCMLRISGPGNAHFSPGRIIA